MNIKDNKYWINKIENKDDRIILEEVLLYSANDKERIDLINIQSASDKLKNWKSFDSNKAWNKVSNKKSNTRFSIVKYAASIVILIAFGLSFLLFQNNTVEYKTTSSNLHVVLQDGSDIVLSPNSKLRLSSSFNDTKRSVTLVGNAYFNIERNTAKPFIVKTSNGDVEVLGTVFYITQDIGSMKVDLISGKVKVSNNSAETAFLNKNETAIVNNKIIVENTRVLDIESIEDLVFDNVTIKDAISTLNKVYGKNIIELEDNNSYLLNETIHITVENSSVREFLNGLKLIFNVKVINAKGKFIISAVKSE
jgi:ferric-dicitrate binding protein FerR (iron transport regulator)